ncbi:general secretion pathway protein D [Desulfuromusa kysingii]|uniref:General secretion pathway protein D n=1 Tax=Desulfuromusa kysingii TaxID=37625 RepID=A0A1H4CR83_9BACT|nr:type II secretion system secretin GspD [Desulfuromusa kysingii]SEA62893.1 general secretion pathway protein D [Desulfuromusa kysingii]
MRIHNILILLAALTCLFVTPVLIDTHAATPPDDRISLDIKDIEITELIKTISELTGKNFLFDESVKGKVTIVTPEVMTLDEIYQLFLTVLNVKGYTLIPSGKVNKIVSVKNARQENLPLRYSSAGSNSEQFITRLVRLDYLDVDTVANSVLAPLMPATGNIIAYPKTNTLILTESAATIERLVKILKQLDQPDLAGDMVSFQLKYADATEVAQICTEILAEKATSTRSSKKSNLSISAGTSSKIIPYTRTNSLIVLADEESLERIKNLLPLLDRELSEEKSNINIYSLENADAETLAETLNQILSGIKAETTTKAAGTKNNTTPLSSTPVSITADTPTNSLIINAQYADYNVIKNIIKGLDIKRKQVYVEALILEISMDATRELGASLSGAVDLGNDSLLLGTSNLNSGSTSLSDLSSSSDSSLLSSAIDGLLLGGLFNPITVTGTDGEDFYVPAISALIDISENNDDVNILSAPRLLTSNNKEATIVVGANVPIITEILTDSSSLSQSVSVERQDVALTLRFTPQIIEDNLVKLDIFQEITGLISTSDELGPTLSKRQIQNTILAQSNHTVVLGGLIGTDSQETVSKVPILGDIPGLGWLFKHTNRTDQKTNLLIFITPSIINSQQDLVKITTKNKIAAQKFIPEDMQESFSEQISEGDKTEIKSLPSE